MPGPDDYVDQLIADAQSKADSYVDNLISQAQAQAQQAPADTTPDPQAVQQARDYAQGNRPATPFEHAALQDPAAAAASARELDANRPLELRGEQTAYADLPWYGKLRANLSSVPGFDAVAGSPVTRGTATGAENVGQAMTSQTADEIVASGLADPENPRERALATTKVPTVQDLQPRDPSTVNQYAAGSEKEDLRRTIAAEQQERSDQDQLPAFAGQVIGSGIQAAALPYGGAASQAAKTVGGAVGKRVAGTMVSNAAQLGSNMLGAGHGDLSERAHQAVQTAEEHPLITGAGVLAPLLAAGVQPAIQKTADVVQRWGWKNRGAAVLNKAQRTVLAERNGPEAIVKLGQDIEEQGLHKQPWWKSFMAPSASTYYENAAALRAKAGAGLERTEDAIINQHGNPEVPVEDIAQQLEQGADALNPREIINQSEAVPEADYMRKTASGIRNIQTKLPVPRYNPRPEVPQAQPFVGPLPPPPSPPGPRLPGPYAPPVEPVPPQPRLLEGPATPEVPANPGRKVTADDWFKYLQDTKDLPPGSPLPPEPIEIPPTEYQPSRGPGTVEPSAQEWKDYRRARELFENPPVEEPTAKDWADYHAKVEQSKGLGMQQPTERQWQEYREALAQPINAPDEPAGTTDFRKAVKNRRDLDSSVKRTRRGGYKGAPMEEQVLETTGNALRGNIRTALDDAAAKGQVPSEVVNDWKKYNKQFSVAATVENPTLAAMQGEYGGNLGLKDMAGTSVMQAAGLPGVTALAAAKHMAAPGRTPSLLAGSAGNLSSLLRGAAKVASPEGVTAMTMHPITEAVKSAPPGSTKQEVVQSANDSLKSQLQEAQQAGNNWFDKIANVY